MNTYLVKWGGLGDGEQILVSSMSRAIELMKEHNGKIFIADGKNTKELDGTKIQHYLAEEESEGND